MRNGSLSLSPSRRMEEGRPASRSRWHRGNEPGLTRVAAVEALSGSRKWSAKLDGPVRRPRHQGVKIRALREKSSTHRPRVVERLPGHGRKPGTDSGCNERTPDAGGKSPVTSGELFRQGPQTVFPVRRIPHRTGAGPVSPIRESVMASGLEPAGHPDPAELRDRHPQPRTGMPDAVRRVAAARRPGGPVRNLLEGDFSLPSRSAWHF